MEPVVHTLVYQLRLLFGLERSSLEFIRAASKSVWDTDFNAALRAKRPISAGQVRILKLCVKQIGGTFSGATSHMIDGARSELALLLKTQGTGTQLDLQICCLIQAVVHSKLSICESTIAHARALNLPDAELLLLEYLGEERTFDSSVSLWRDSAIGAAPAGMLPAK